MAWVAKVNRHVRVHVQKTVQGNTKYIKVRPGIITGFALDGAPIVRVRHYDTDNVTPGVQLETYGNATNGVVRQTTTNTTPGGDWRANTYISW